MKIYFHYYTSEKYCFKIYRHATLIVFYKYGIGFQY